MKKQTRRSSVRTTRKVSSRERNIERGAMDTGTDQERDIIVGKAVWLAPPPRRADHWDLRTSRPRNSFPRLAAQQIPLATAAPDQLARIRLGARADRKRTARVDCRRDERLSIRESRLRMLPSTSRPSTAMPAASIADMLDSSRAAVLRRPRSSTSCALVIALLVPRLRELVFSLCVNSDSPG